MIFRNRRQAALQLASALRQYKGRRVTVFAIPRGGVVLGSVVAKTLGASLNLIIPRKIGHPDNPEYAVAVVSESGKILFGSQEKCDVNQQWLLRAAKEGLAEARRRRQLYLGSRQIGLSQNTACIIIDDGMATGLTMKAAVCDLQKLKPEKIIIAVPVASVDAVKELENFVDELVVLYVPAKLFGSVGLYYQEFGQLSDKEVIEWITLARQK